MHTHQISKHPQSNHASFSPSYTPLAECISPDTLRTFNITEHTTRNSTLWQIPIHDEKGVRVGVLLKNLFTSSEKHYLRINKEPVIFNLNRATEFAHDGGSVTITEDAYDCIRLWEAGERRIVSLLGCGLSESQVSLIFGLMAPNRIRYVFCASRGRDHCRMNTIAMLAQRTYLRTTVFHRTNRPPRSAA